MFDASKAYIKYKLAPKSKTKPNNISNSNSKSYKRLKESEHNEIGRKKSVESIKFPPKHSSIRYQKSK